MTEKMHHVVVYVDSHPTDTAAAPPMLELHDACWPVKNPRPGVMRYRLEFDIPANVRTVDGEIVPEVYHEDWVRPDVPEKRGGQENRTEAL